MNFSIDTALRAEYSRRGLSDSFLEGKGSYISYRGRTESFIERNVERADIWMSYYAGRCTGSLVQAAGGTAAMFFGAMDAISGGIGTAGSAALGQAPAAALTAALTVEGVLTAGAGAVVLADVLRKQAVASAGMTQSVGRGLERKSERDAEAKYSGDLQKVDNPDTSADALADRIGGESRVKFSNDPSGREFDVVSDEYIAQAKPDLKSYGKSWRNQTKATFEAAKATGRKAYFQFEGTPADNILRKIAEYGERYGVDYVIDTIPLGVHN